MYKKNFLVLGLISITLLILTLITGCSGDTGNNSGAKDDGPRAGWPTELSYGVLPSEDQSTMTKRYEPMQKYLEEKLDMPVKLFFGTDYTAMIEAMRNKHIDVAHYGPFSYILANERGNAEAFSMGVKAVDSAFYTSIIITRDDAGIDSLEDLKGKTFAFVDPASTSGHLFPRALLINELGITNDEVEGLFSNVVFSGGHDASVVSVLNGDIQAAAVASHIYATVMATNANHPDAGKMKVIAETADIPRGPEAIRKDLPESFKKAVEEAFLSMANEPHLKDFLKDATYDAGFIPASDDQYEVIRMTAGALGMSAEELLK